LFPRLVYKVFVLLLKKKVVVVETKERKSKKKEREREKQKVSIRAAVLNLFCVTTFVSMLTSLSKVYLAQDQHDTVVERLFNLLFTNVVLAIPCASFSAHLQLHIYPGYSLTKLLLQHPIHFSLGC
jgi:NADH:ubiquinone oxidoreductase subunit 6 (subunit J)